VLRGAGQPGLFAVNALILAEGAPPTHAVVIEEGIVWVTATAETGLRSLLAFRGPGELIGELSCIDGAPMSASVTALTQVKAHLIRPSRFREVLNERPDILFTLLAETIKRLRQSDQRALEFSAYLPFERVARTLLDLVRRQHGERVSGLNGPIRVKVYRRDLPIMTGAPKSTTDRALRDLTVCGAISTGRGEIVVHDLDLLRGVAAKLIRANQLRHRG
jgi:CRP/FNR family transcriptional regulator, cyclic AMP receptor protein